MDPYIEMQDWESFHATFIVDIADALGPLVEPKYVTRAQRRIYVEHPSETDSRTVVVDTAIVRPPVSSDDWSAVSPSAGAVATVEVLLPMPETRYETYLTVRDVETLEVVTVIELLSPYNKRGGEGRREYLRKRDEVLRSDTNLVELDLLRGGQRLPTITPLPPGDYSAIISRASRRPRAQALGWTIRQPLPPIVVPLREGEPDVVLELQPLFNQRYDRGNFRYSLVYSAPVEPPLNCDDEAWASELLRGFRIAG